MFYIIYIWLRLINRLVKLFVKIRKSTVVGEIVFGKLRFVSQGVLGPVWGLGYEVRGVRYEAQKVG